MEEEEIPLPDRCVVVGGVCYVAPYMRDRVYSVRDAFAGQPVAEVLAHAFRHATQEVAPARTHFLKEAAAGRILLERHKNARDDTRPFTSGFAQVLDGEMATEKGDRLRVVRHLHERAFALRSLLRIVWRNKDDTVRVVHKPPGLPVVDEEGGVGTVGGMMGGWRCGHRLDVCVSGILIMCKGGGTQARVIKALGPEGKLEKGVKKFYLARVRGRLEEERRLCVTMKHDSRAKRSFVVEDGTEGSATVTIVQGGGKYDEKTDTSVVVVQIESGYRHQIRCALAHMGHPIVYDTVYGGGECEETDYFVGGKNPRLYADDEAGTLQKMLRANAVEWCDKCRWQLREAENGGSERGAKSAKKAFHYICLHAWRYVVPEFGIDATCTPPEWAVL